MWSPADVMSAGATAPARPRRRRFPPWVAAAGWLPARRQPSLPRWRLARRRAVGSLARAACGVASGRRRVVRESEAEAKIADGFRNQTSHTHVGVCELGRLPIVVFSFLYFLKIKISKIYVRFEIFQKYTPVALP